MTQLDAAGEPHVIPGAWAIFPEFDEDVGPALEDFSATLDDIYWARFVREWHGWRGVSRWWIARRWVRPRDVRRE